MHEEVRKYGIDRLEAKEWIQMKGGQRKEAGAPCCERDKGREKGDVRLISDLSRLGSSIIAHCALWLERIVI